MANKRMGGLFHFAALGLAVSCLVACSGAEATDEIVLGVTTNGPPLPVQTVSSTNSQITYRLKKPFDPTLSLAVINVSLNATPGAPTLVGTIKKGTAAVAGSANLQANQAKFAELKSGINEVPLSVTLTWGNFLAPVNIRWSSGGVATP